ncbi:MAG: ATP-binding protein, partial [bacterium]|nr:ATP-binding protein [bacterium]
YSGHTALREEMTNIGIILAHSVEVPFSLQDYHEAEKTLNSLASDNRNIQSITAYNHDGRVLATYRKPGLSPTPATSWSWSFKEYPFTFEVPIGDNHFPQNYLIIKTISPIITNHFQILLISYPLIILLMLPVSWRNITRLIEKELEPLDELGKAIMSASHEGCYSIRLRRNIHDEFATIYYHFNTLMENLQKQSDEKLAIVSALEKHQTQLEQLIAENTEELNGLHLELLKKEKLATLGQIIASVSHELRNPLGTIVSSLFTISQNTTADNKAVHKAIARSQRSIKRCVNIIEELLDYTRISSLKLTPLHFDSWLRQVIEDFPFPETTSVVTSLNCETEVDIQPERLQRAIDNLLTNASQAFNHSLENSAPSISISSIEENTQVKIEIRDNGCGMDERTLEQIFEPLFSTKSFGVGLGLPIVKQVIEAHNGQIKIDSAPNQGTTVTVIIPKSSDAQDIHLD